MIKIEANYIYVANIDLADDETIEYYCQNLPEYFGDAVQHFGTSKEVLDFCANLSKKLDKLVKSIPTYLEKEMEK